MTPDPLDTLSVRHYFEVAGERLEILGPVGFDAANFVLEKEPKRYGSDVSFASDSVQLSFDPNSEINGLTHRFDLIMEHYKRDGFESYFLYILSIDEGDGFNDYVIGELDFEESATDEFSYFRCKIIQNSDQAKIKRRMEVSVDVFSDEDSDGEPIAPLITQPVFYRANPLAQESRWELFETYYRVAGGVGGSFFYDFNPFPVITKSQVENTISPPIDAGAVFGRSDFFIIEAENTIQNGTLKIENLDYSLALTQESPVGFAYGRLFYSVGTSFIIDDAVEVFRTGTMRWDDPDYPDNRFDLENASFEFNNITIERDEKLFLFFEFVVNTENGIFFAENTVSGGNITFTGVSTSISSVVQTFKLIDLMNQVVKSISGLEVQAPRFEEGGEFYMQHVFDGKLMRAIVDDSFYISLKDILDHYPEFNGDYQVLENGKVFFGIYEDFYADKKIGSFVQAPDDTFEHSFNKRYSINRLEMKYRKYEKESEEVRSRESVHTEMQLLLPNKRVENVKQVNIGFIRDSLLLESTRKKAIRVDDKTATSNDDDKFILDVIQKSLSQSLTFSVQHFPNSEDNTILKLVNDASFNWLFLGFLLGDFIEITTDENGGDWLITGIEPTVLELTASGATVADYTGTTQTQLNFNVTATNLTNRTSEGFDVVENVTDPDSLSNLLFTPKRNTHYYWGQYLSTACLYYRTANDLIRVTKFIHNNELKTQFSDDNLEFIEGASINIFVLKVQKPPILDTIVGKTSVLCTFFEFWTLRNGCINERGYVEISDHNGNIINVYPTKLDYQWPEGRLYIDYELKYDR